MAVDTKAKRFSMLNFGSISTDLLPDPDGTIGQADRQHLLDLYGGILAAAPAAATPGIEYTAPTRRMHSTARGTPMHHNVRERRMHYTAVNR